MRWCAEKMIPDSSTAGTADIMLCSRLKMNQRETEESQRSAEAIVGSEDTQRLWIDGTADSKDPDASQQGRHRQTRQHTKTKATGLRRRQIQGLSIHAEVPQQRPAIEHQLAHPVDASTHRTGCEMQ